MDFATRYRLLNSAQREAVDHIDGPVMVIAGPGTGKTELLSMRTANILQKTDTLPENILCLTFTESGANAMRERLKRIISSDAYKVAIHTFHSFGMEVMNHYGEFFYHGAHFRAADELSCYELLRTILDGLEYSNPLAVKMNGDYTHLGDILTVISELKKSGLTNDELLLVLDANDHVIEMIEPKLAAVFAKKLSKTTIDHLEPLLPEIRASGGEVSLPTITSLSRVLSDSLEHAITYAKDSSSTKPITAWRNKWFKKNEQGDYVLKARDRQTKLRAVSYVYYQYLMRMQEAELYDYDDMILRVVHAIEVFPELRFNLQEKFHYIMVDEFQDTNMAQMRILHNLTNHISHNAQPNILVVGDDDQAIYSFQGAEVSNMTAFLEHYTQTTCITLADNYRSTEMILSHARQVIMQAEERLENTLPQLDKTLTAHRDEADTRVELVELATRSDEYDWLVAAITAQLREGTAPASIAILARRHHEIIALLPYLTEAGIAVNYERRDNVLDLEVIKVVEYVGQTLVALFEKRHQDAESLLPQLLAHPAFGFDALALWRLSLTAQNNHHTWMETMAVTPAFQPLHKWLVATAQTIAYTPLERVLDTIIGSDDAKEDDFISPLFTYFFSKEKLAETPDTYLLYLEALRTIRAQFHDYHPHETPTLQSFLEFIRMHRQLGSTITSLRPANVSGDAIHVMTAHKSKGLEFDTVYIMGAVDTAWGERVRTRSRLIGYPENLPFAPSGDTYDERLRLFFVAMTRARRHLIITYSLVDDSGKATMAARFLASGTWQPQAIPRHTQLEQLAQAAERAWYQPVIAPITSSMKDLLAPWLADYKLSSTHFNTFLDVPRGGPQLFLMQNLLHFPHALQPSAAYGIAIHASLHHAHAHLNTTGTHRPIEDTLHDFETHLRRQHLTEKEFSVYLQKGSEALSVFLENQYDYFTPTQKTELTFANQAVYVGNAHLTGLLDVVDIVDDTITITDYKTGKASRSWNGKTEYEKIKLHKYKQQLMFYYLLIQHSRDYSKYAVRKARLHFIEPLASGEIIALEATFAREDLERLSRLIQAVWQHITTLDLPDISYYPPTYQGILAFENGLLSETF